MTLLRPEALWVLLLAAPLVLLHLRRVRRQRVEVASVRLWRELAGGPAAQRGLRQPRELLTLLALLLALGAFGVALARPVTGSAPAPGRSLVVVLDASATMTARDADGSRFEAARRVVPSALDRLGPGDDVTLWLAGPSPRALVAPTRDIEAARAALASARPSLAPRTLGATVESARRSLELRGVEAPLLVVTDAPGAASLPAEVGLSHVVQVGRSSVSNAAVTDLVAGPGALVSVRVAAREGPQPARRVELFEVTDDGVERVLATADVGVPTADGEWYVLTPGAATGVLGVRLAPADDFPDDDVAGVHLVDDPPLRIGVVAPGGRVSPFVRSALDALEGRIDAAGSRVVSPDVDAAALAGVDVVVGDGALPDVLPAELPVVAFVERGEIIERPLLWSAGSHPVLDGVDLAPLRIDRAGVQAPGAGERALVETASGAVAVVRDAAPRRVMFSFRPGASTLPLEPAFPLLIRNALDWTVRRSRPPAVVRSGDPIPLPDAFARRGAELQLMVGDDGAARDRVALGPDGAEPTAPRPVSGARRVVRVSDATGALVLTSGLLWNLPRDERLGGESPGLPADAVLAGLLPPRETGPPLRERAPHFAWIGAALLALGTLTLAPRRPRTARPALS